MAQKYTRAVGSVQSNGVGGWNVDVDLRPVTEEKVAHISTMEDLERGKLRLEVQHLEADIEFTKAATRMKIAEARKLEAQALLDEAMVGIERQHVPRAVHETRISQANVRIAEARAAIEERNNRHQEEDESRRRNNASLAEKLASTT